MLDRLGSSEPNDWLSPTTISGGLQRRSVLSGHAPNWAAILAIHVERSYRYESSNSLPPPWLFFAQSQPKRLTDWCSSGVCIPPLTLPRAWRPPSRIAD